jgi:hypothetical protein
MIARGLLALCAPFLVIALIACGDGGDETQSTDDFTAEVEDYCVNRSQATVEALEKIGGPRASVDFDMQLEQTETTLPVSTDTAEGLAEFDPPAELAEDWNEFVSLRQEAVDLGADALEAGKSGDEKAYQAALEKNAELRDEANAIGEDLGFTACAGNLAPEDEEAVTSVIEEVATEAAPEQCTELVTQNYLDNNFGKIAGDELDDPLAACEQFQEELVPDDLAKSVDVREIRGPEPAATVDVVESGGANDGETEQWRLVKENDEWRVSDIAILTG